MSVRIGASMLQCRLFTATQYEMSVRYSIIQKIMGLNSTKTV